MDQHNKLGCHGIIYIFYVKHLITFIFIALKREESKSKTRITLSKDG